MNENYSLLGTIKAKKEKIPSEKTVNKLFKGCKIMKIDQGKESLEINILTNNGTTARYTFNYGALSERGYHIMLMLAKLPAY